MIPTACVFASAVSLGGAAGLVGISGFDSPAAWAGPFTEVASAFDPGDGIDVNITLDYGFDIKRAAIKREFSGFPGTDPDASIPRVRDLVFKSTRHTLVPRLELGVFTDLSLSAALPLVLSDGRTLELDQRDTPCVFPGGIEEPTCIDRTNSTTINDGLLPASGFDANDPTGPGFTDGAMLFRGPTRRGIDQVHLGLTWAPMNQARDDTKPTWKIGAEARLAVGRVMHLDVADPGADTGVGRGLHEIRIWTSVAKHMGWADPYIEMWWLAPFAMTDDSPFQDLGFGQQRPAAQQHAGTRFGFEAVLVSRPERQRRVSVDVAARLESHFEGRGYSEMWEVFQYAGAVGSGGPLVLDRDPVTDGLQELEYPGVSKIENHLSYGGRLGIRGELGPHLQLGATFEVMGTQGHVITFEDAGDDLPTCDANITVNCEIDNNVLVNPGTAEVNPAHVALVDLVGQRYHADDIVDYALLIDLRFLF